MATPTMANLDAWADFLAKPEATGAWQFDPALMMRDLGLEPDPWQADFLNMSYRRALLLCSRRSGKTTVVAIKALHHAMFASPKEPATVLLFAHAGKQTEELLFHLHAFYKNLGKPIPRDTDRISQLDFENGSRILAFKSNPDSLVGFTPTLVIIDEAARVDEEMYRAIAPMRALGKCQLIALSTPHGKQGWFYREWADPEREWYRVRKTSDDCPRIDKTVIEEDRRSFGDPFVRQEYGCHFEVMEGLVYPEFEACIVDPGALNFVPTRGWAGCDFGWHAPSAFIALVSDADDVLYAVEEIYANHLTDEELALRARPLCERWRIQRVYCDGANPQSIEKLRRASIPAVAANKAVTDGIRAVGARIRTARFKCSRACVNLIREMGLYHYDPERKLPTDDPVKEHDHAPDALRYCIAGVDRIKEPHGLPRPPAEPEPKPPVDHERDYCTSPPQERYRKIELKRPLTAEEAFEQSGEARRLQQEHLDNTFEPWGGSSGW